MASSDQDRVVLPGQEQPAGGAAWCLPGEVETHRRPWVGREVIAPCDRCGVLIDSDHKAVSPVTVPDLIGALRFILAFYEPGQRHLDTNAWKSAESRARYLVASYEAQAAKATGDAS